jgi:hypothetical protein
MFVIVHQPIFGELNKTYYTGKKYMWGKATFAGLSPLSKFAKIYTSEKRALYGCKCLSKKVDNIYNGDFVVEYFKEEL